MRASRASQVTDDEIADVIPFLGGQSPVGASLQAVIGHVVPQACEPLNVVVHPREGKQLVLQIVDDVVGDGGHIGQAMQGRQGGQRLGDGHFVVGDGAEEGAGEGVLGVDTAEHVHAGAMGQAGGGGAGGITSVGGGVDQSALSAHASAHDRPGGLCGEAVLVPQGVHQGVDQADGTPVHPAPRAGEHVGLENAVVGKNTGQRAVVGGGIHASAQARAAAQPGKFQNKGTGRGTQQMGVGVAVTVNGIGVDKITVTCRISRGHGCAPFG